MSTIVTRSGKGSPLTNAEMDSNLTNLNTDKLEKNGSTVMTGDLQLGATFGVSFEGTTDDANETRLIAVDPTADRVVSLPNATTTLVGQDTTDTLTNKTIQAATFTDGYTEETVTANTSTSYTISLANGTVQILTLTGNCTYTFPSTTAGTSFLLVQKQDGTGSRTVTWPASVKWPASTAPTLTSTASKADVFAFTCDGTYWYGRVVGQNYL